MSDELLDESVQITHVAIKYDSKTYSLPAPNRHHDVIRMIAFINGEGIKGPDVQGFMTEHNQFLNRKEAFALASVNGQLKRGPGGYQGNQLFSEDLW